MVQCPQCRSQTLYKDGLRYLTDGSSVQRWLCRLCGYRFSQLQVEFDVAGQALKGPCSHGGLSQDLVSESGFSGKKVVDGFPFSLGEDVASHMRPVAGQGLNRLRHCNRTCQVGASLQDAKNLTENTTRQEQALREGTTSTADIKGILVTYEAKMILKGLNQKTIQRRVNLLQLLRKRGADLFNPQSVFQTIDQAKKWDHKNKTLTEEAWSEGSKNNAAQSYTSLCELAKIPIPEDINFSKWGRQPQKIPWIPLETEIDQLIAGCLPLTGTFLQLLKETGIRSGEAVRLTWPDIDIEHGILTINKPEKHSLPRQFKISTKLAAMLNRLPKNSDKAFSPDLRTIRKRFMWQRNKIAFKVQNPRLRRITFHTLRHWFGSMEYHKTKNILHVQERLGHRSITSTLIYTHLVSFEGDEYNTAIAKTLKEDEELLKSGFEYVTERDGIKIYRKRK